MTTKGEGSISRSGMKDTINMMRQRNRAILHSRNDQKSATSEAVKRKKRRVALAKSAGT